MDKPIRIIHIVSSININSGVMSVLMNYYRHIDKSKLQFDFLYYSEGIVDNYKAEITKNGGRCFFVTPPNHNPIGFEKDIHSFYKEHYKEYYAIHLHDTFLPFFLFDSKRKLGAKKIIAHAHLTSYGDKTIKSIRNYLLSLPKYLIVNQFWACSHEAGYALAGKRTFSKKGRILHNAINLNKFSYSNEQRNSIRSALGVSDSFVIGHIGHFSAQKNHTFLIDVFNAVKKKRSDTKLILIGDGELKSSIIAQCKEYSLEDSVLFLGVRNDVNNLLSAFDAFCFPSLYEGLPVSLIEAQAVGIPCVYSDTISSEVNILKEQNLVINLNEGAEKWSDAVLKSMKHSTNPHCSLQNAGYDIITEANKLIDYYLDV